MLKAGLELVGEAAFERVILSTAKDRVEDEKTSEQQLLERRVRIAQKVLGTLFPPAGTAMLVLEHGPVIVADFIESDAAKKIAETAWGAAKCASKCIKSKL